ncbi:MAG: tRNA pseudouridine(38-40) synthase TruA [Pseudomonadota bacterium]
MPRYKLTLEYDGRPFAGWQRQRDQPSVQETVEQAVEALIGEPATVQGAGRTDAGVHALAQVAHVDLARDWDSFRLTEALNHHLRPAPVAVLSASVAADDWHARFSAIERLYVYRIVNRRAPLTIEAGKAWRVRQPLDAEAMAAAAKHLEGEHDFTTFRASLCQAKSPVKTVNMVAVDQDGPALAIYVRARSFLHNQVRSFVGTLAEVGSGKWTPDDVRRALEAKDRAACGPVAPPDGLYLASVKYPA